MKKLVSLTLALAMILTCLSGLVFAADPIAKVTTGDKVVEVDNVPDMLAAIDASGNSVITLLTDVTYEKIIRAPYVCTLDLNGKTLRTTSGNAWDIQAVGTANEVAVVKNGTIICDKQMPITSRYGGLIVENVVAHATAGYALCYNETSTKYNDVNKISGSTLISLAGAAISFNFADAAQDGVKMTIENSKLIAGKEAGSNVFDSKKGGAIAVLAKGVEMYSYKPDNWLTSKITAEGETVTAEFTLGTVEAPEVDTKLAGLSYWHTPEYVAPAPVVPETPAAPETPTAPETPATPSVPTTTVPDVTTPATGVSVVALGVMAMVSLAGAVLTKKH